MLNTEPSSSNLPPTPTAVATEPTTLSVAELDRRLRTAVEGASVGAWVQGEVRGLKVAASGHVYFTLKDEHQDAMIEAVAYRDDAIRARRVLCEGARVIVRGKATVWAPRGRLQFVVETARACGRGALLEALEKLREKLRAEGLFDHARKQAIPTDARSIGVVTSSSGAVIHDIIKVAFRRGSPRILLAPAQVQGEEAPRSIMAALSMLQLVSGIDVIIVGRGGGSADDLMAFNDEQLVRCVAACPIPVVSAVGHEVDVTLLDLVADARAATPSQAAEMVVADQQRNVRTLSQTRSRLRRAMRARLMEHRSELRELELRLSDPRLAINENRQLLDDLVQRAHQVIKDMLRERRSTMDRLARCLVARHPQAVLARARGDMRSLQLRSVSAMRGTIRDRRADLVAKETQLVALSPLAVLTRGYAIAVGPDGHVLLDASQVEPGDVVSLRLRRGMLSVEVRNSMAG
ncbi:MAG: exodeoxyribonuclease VII large subunit [Polyangiaceae bacterium]|nr:exodeoxyribonuclease VII large subunit [Polyangiaceae bacterium]